MVVPCSVGYHDRVRFRVSTRIPYWHGMVLRPSFAHHCHHFHHSYWYDSGFHQHSAWSQCFHRIHHRLHPTWPPHRHDDVHYMHVPQRTMFMAQLVATVWSCLCQLATVEWAMGTIKNVCTKAAQGNFTCASIKTFYNASVIWGAIGPKHIFSSGAVYTSLQYFWVAGFLAPFVVYGLARAFPKVSLIRKVSMPLIFACFSYVPPYSAMNIVSYSNSSADMNLCANIYDSFLGSWSVGLSTNSSVTSTVDGGWSTTTSPLLLGTLVLLSAPSSSSSVSSFPATACLITGELSLSATLWMALAAPLTPERWLPMARSLVQPREHGSGNLGRDRFFQTDIWRQQLGDFGRTRYPVFSLYVYIIFDNSMSFSS
jgi:hypothetical protein